MKKLKTDLLLIYELSHTYRDAFIKEFEDNYEVPDNLNKTHLRTLMYINFEEKPKMSLISGKMGLEKGSFTPVAQKLMELGYITKNKTEEKMSELSDTEQSELQSSLKIVLEFSKKLLEN